jgi:hypothetical protein
MFYGQLLHAHLMFLNLCKLPAYMLSIPSAQIKPLHEVASPRADVRCTRGGQQPGCLDHLVKWLKPNPRHLDGAPNDT